MSTTNQQNLSTIKNVDLRKSHPHQQNWSIVQIVDSLLDPNQQMVSLKIGETTKCTLGFFLHNNKFVDQQSGSNVQIVVSGPTSTNCVIPNLPRGSRQLYQPAAGAKCILYFFPDAHYSNPKQLSLKSSYTPPKSSYANPSLLNQSSAGKRRGILLKSILLNYPRPIHYSQKKLGGVYLCLATPQRCASQLFNQDYSKANLQTKLCRKIKLGAFLA